MDTLLIGYAFSLLLVTVILASLAVYAWNRRDHSGGTALSLVLTGTAIWSLAAAAGIFTRGTAQALVWARVVYVGVVILVASLFVFSLAYAGHDRFLDRRIYALLTIEPLVLFGAMLFGPEGLVYRIPDAPGGGMYGWDLAYGPVFWGHVAYSYTLIGVASVVILHYAFDSGELYRWQVYAVLVAIFLPWFGNVLSTFGGMAIELTPLLFGTTGIALSWAFFQARLLDISPVAYREVVETLNSAVFIVDTRDTIIEVNDAGRQLLNGESIIGASVQSALGQWPGLVEHYRQTDVTDGEVQTVIEQDERFFDVYLSPLTDDRGELVGNVFLVHEITARKARERELERRNRQLDQFAAVVSHDLRNPLNVASGRLALARERNDPEEFDRVEEAHERMSRLIDDVLAFARDEKATDDAELQLSALARAAWSHVDTAAATLQIDGDRTVVGDRDQLLQLFENVFRNSVEHGGEDVTIFVNGTDDGFTIADDGPGIPASERSTVFEHGYTSSTDGTGLGLAIVQHVVGSHGWEVEMGASDTGGAKLEISGLESVSAASPAS